MSVQLLFLKDSLRGLKGAGPTIDRESLHDLDSSTQGTGNEELDKAIEIAGYAYDPEQDIFYSIMDPWQRKIGYCRLYDEASALSGMIIDCEPIYFEYWNKKWMIGLWKGQYDLVTGGEIGVYIGGLDLNIPGLLSGTFYNCASNDDLLQMSYTLKKNGETLLTREGKHWWLTGFKLGEFSEPSELTMYIDITLSNALMRDAFVGGLKNAGYTEEQITVTGNTVSFIFDTPHTAQPITRMATFEIIMQKKNKALCEKYQEITGEFTNIRDKVKAVEELSPEMYSKVIKVGRTKQLLKLFGAIMLFSTMIGITIVSNLISDSRDR